MTISVDRVVVSTSTVGTGDFVLTTAFKSKYRTLADAVTATDATNGDVVGYFVEEGDLWEVGEGTVAASGATLQRTTIVRTSAGDTNPITLAGAAVVYVSEVSSIINALDGGGDTEEVKVSAIDAAAGFLEAKLAQSDGSALAQVDLGGGVLQMRLPPVGAPGAHAATHREGGGDAVQLTQAQVDNLTTDLAGKEPTISPKNTGFNKDFGTTAGTVAEGNHDHTGVYDPAGAAAAVQANLDLHEADVGNPHTVTQAQVGLGNVDNTSDADKPISTATQTALDEKVTGPASAVDGELASYNGATGKIIKGGSASFGGTVETRGNALNISTAGDVLHGTLLDTPEGVALAYTPGSVYDPDDGGVEPVSGGVVLHGAAIAVDQWAATDGTTYNVTQTNGVLSFEPQPPPGWVDETTGVGEAALDFLGVWVPVTVTQNATQIQVTVQEDVAVGAPMAVSSVVYITNSSSDRGGTVTIGYSVNGGAPIAIGAPHYIPGGFSGMVLPPAVEAAAGYTAGDTVELWARRETEEHGQFAPAIDGTIGTHDLRISVASSGASAPSAPTEREITQSGATTITIADNETVVLTTDNTLATIEVAAPAAGKATIGTLIVIDGGSGNNLSFPGVAADWANGGNIPDTTADRHTIGLQRGASGTYTLTHGAHQ